MDPAPRITRRRLRVGGLVQGVGFRPHVARLAARHGLAGLVDNGPEGVRIEVEGEADAVEAFTRELRPLAPPLAVVARLEREDLAPTGESGFHILPSRQEGPAAALIPPDTAPCAACLAEMRDPADRRHGYPFLNCTNCGPRYTLVASLPYDRPGTAMAGFPLCPACRAEYEDPLNRRHHAQPTACPACGPRLLWRDGAGRPWPERQPLAEAWSLLRSGGILGVKGVGGFHLACDPCDGEAVARLRRGKQRPHKPLAVMARDLASAGSLARLTPDQAALLASWRAPIVLVEPRHPLPVAAGVPGERRSLGLFLPCSPLHHLLLAGPLPALVMTSANRGGEPIATTLEEALEGLGGVVDGWLDHDRPIIAALEDSVVRAARGGPVLLRRGRGWVPQPVPLPREGPSVVAVGGDLKGACCVTRGAQAFPGPCLGDLEQPGCLEGLERSLRHLVRLLGVRPAQVVHDLHPDYHSTRLARRLAAEWGVPLLAVQHHHAHALAVLAEHAWCAGPVLAVCWDGTGLGPDGQAWGGEFLRVDGMRWSRLAGLRPLPLPGGDRAAREPWRMGLAALRELGLQGPGPGPHPPSEPWPDPRLAAAVWESLGAVGQVPTTSSAGRLLDAAASLLGIRQVMSYEGQAAAELEEAAASVPPERAYPFTWEEGRGGTSWELDTRPLLAALLDDRERGVEAAVCARRLHEGLARLIVGVAERVSETGIRTVVLSGGVFQNVLLLERTVALLEEQGLQVLCHGQVPPNDEGLSLGQAWAGLLPPR